MPNTYTQLYVQFVFAVKHRAALIHAYWKDELYKYITGIIQNKENKMLSSNGMSDHLHFFIGYNPKNTIPDLVKDVKLATNEWIKDNKLCRSKFAWQEGYGAFSYSRSQVPDVCLYIENQELHHAKKSFREEYLAFLKAFDVDFEEKYLFEFFDDLYPVTNQRQNNAFGNNRKEQRPN